MNDIKVLTKLYELMELIGREDTYKILERALTDTRRSVAEEDMWHDDQEQKRLDRAMSEGYESYKDYVESEGLDDK